MKLYHIALALTLAGATALPAQADDTRVSGVPGAPHRGTFNYAFPIAGGGGQYYVIQMSSFGAVLQAEAVEAAYIGGYSIDFLVDCARPVTFHGGAIGCFVHDVD